MIQGLCGLELSRSTRAANVQCFHFGALQTKNNSKAMVGEYSLHIQCPWRITDSEEILVGSEDLYEPPSDHADYNSDFDWDKPMANLRDVKLQRLVDSNQLIVKTVVTYKYGGLDIKFNEGITFSLFPAISGKDEFLEYWRLIDNRVEVGNHLVVGPLGAEEV